MLRFMAWLSLKDNALSGSQMCIVTGPRIDLAIALIDRMKKLFAGKIGHTATFDTKETVIELNNVKIEAFPSHHLDAMRGLPNVSFILLDEADFFPPGQQQQDARDVSERYIAKSNPYIVMVSTPNAPDGLFERIEKEAEDICLYKRIFLDYTYGIGKIYSQEEIEKAKQSSSFEREYNLKYLGKIGNVFHTKDIETAIEKGRKYNPDDFSPFYFTPKSMGIDPAWGSSAFGIVVTQ
jgi:late competence protein required for DNA uptake (superfamily II DNA/RNA helicase)